MKREYRLVIEATNLNSNIDFGSWQSVQEYLWKNRRYNSSEFKVESEAQFRETFRTNLPTRFVDTVRRELKQSLEATSPNLKLLDFWRALREFRINESSKALTAEELTATANAIFGTGKTGEPEAVSDLRAAIASSSALTLKITHLRLGSIEAELLLCGYEELQKHLKLDVLGFDAFIETCLTSAVYELYSLADGAVTIKISAVESEQQVAAISTAPGNNPESTPKNSLEDFVATWAKKMFAAAAFPIVLAIVVGGAVVYQFDKIDASRQKLSEQHIDFLKQDSERRKAESGELQKNQTELLNQWKSLVDALKKADK